jgi:ABC-type Na+ efflux pump permease subunit
MNKIKLIIWREFITRVRKPSFLIMTILLAPVLIAGDHGAAHTSSLQDKNPSRTMCS